jgi:hypothetical protein
MFRKIGSTGKNVARYKSCLAFFSINSTIRQFDIDVWLIMQKQNEKQNYMFSENIEYKLLRGGLITNRSSVFSLRFSSCSDIFADFIIITGQICTTTYILFRLGWLFQNKRGREDANVTQRSFKIHSKGENNAKAHLVIASICSTIPDYI